MLPTRLRSRWPLPGVWADNGCHAVLEQRDLYETHQNALNCVDQSKPCALTLRVVQLTRSLVRQASMGPVHLRSSHVNHDPIASLTSKSCLWERENVLLLYSKYWTPKLAWSLFVFRVKSCVPSFSLPGRCLFATIWKSLLTLVQFMLFVHPTVIW